MGRQLGILTPRKVATVTEPGRYADGGNLYLQVTRSKANGTISKSWTFRYVQDGKNREMGLGVFPTVSLALARDDAQRYRLMVRNGIFPMEQREADKAARAGIPTFWDAALDYIEQHKAGWKNAKHAAQWKSTLATYAQPEIGDRLVSEVTTQEVLAILQPIWKSKTETASRVRQRMELVLDAAKAKGQLKGDNPARWKGHLDNLLPKPTKVHTVKHFPALPFKQLPGFMKLVAKQTGTAARALEFLILTASRTNMVTGANRSELEKSGHLWTVPASRMKAKREHVVPLPKQAWCIVQALPEDGEPLFAGDRNPYISNGAMDALLERMSYSHVTVHGFRSTFRDWAAETTSHPAEVVEMALAHTIKDKAEAAYRRGALLAKRKKLMQAWADYCKPPAKKTELSSSTAV